MFGRKAKRIKQLEMELKIAREDRGAYIEAVDSLQQQISELQAAEEPKDSDVEQAMRAVIVGAFEARRKPRQMCDGKTGNYAIIPTVEQTAQMVEIYLRFKREIRDIEQAEKAPF